MNYIHKQGNWYKYDCPKGLAGQIIKFSKDLMKTNDMTAAKVRRFNKVYISCKKTETSTFYKILVHGGKNFICFNMNNASYSYKWYEKDMYPDMAEFDSDDDCSSCGYPTYARERRARALRIKPPLTCHRSPEFMLSKNSDYTKLHEACYKFIDSMKVHIPIRVIELPKPIEKRKAETYLLLRKIRKVYFHRNYRISDEDPFYIFARLAFIPRDVLKIIIGFL